jgi:tetratricopeptide (TPR) repeat protein
MNFSPDGGREGWRTLADIKLAQDDTPGAIEAFRSGIDAFGSAFNAENADLVMGLANLLEKNGDEAELRAHLAQHLTGAHALLDAQGWTPVDRPGEAARALVSGLLRIQLDEAQRLEQAGDKAGAAAVYEQAMVTDPTRDDLLPRAATAWLEAGDAMRAKVMAKRATREHPERAAGWRAMGSIAEAEKRPHEAVGFFTQAWEIDPTQNDVAAKIGTIYLRLGDNEGARRFMGQVASDPTTPPEILLNYALSLQRSGDHALAAAPFRRLVQRDPTNVNAWKGLATSLRALERWNEAAQAYNAVYHLEQDARFAFQEGFCLGKLERFDEAAAAYGRALELDPVYDKALYNRGVVLLRAGESEAALEMFTRLGELEADSYRVHFNSGVCLFNLERYDEALQAYEAALELDETAAVWTNMGHVFDRLGEKAEAQHCFKEARRLQGEH